MTTKVLSVILLPFLGTALGSACVFFMKGQLKRSIQRALMGFESDTFWLPDTFGYSAALPQIMKKPTFVFCM